MKRVIAAITILASAFAITGCTETTLPTFTYAQQAQITQAVDNTMLTYNLPAVILGVWEEGKAPFILSKGKADLDVVRAALPADKFRIASITKTFTGTVMLQLIQEGKISFEATIDPYFPDVTNAGQVTVRQLLAMTAGIYDFVNSDEFNTQYYNNIKKVWTKAEILALINGQPADFAPGTSCK